MDITNKKCYFVEANQNHLFLSLFATEYCRFKCQGILTSADVDDIEYLEGKRAKYVQFKILLQTW